eukprot:SAG31_NODE_29536_length_393_cov_1.571429_1_plen_64_part_10
MLVTHSLQQPPPRPGRGHCGHCSNVLNDWAVPRLHCIAPNIVEDSFQTCRACGAVETGPENLKL